MTHTIICAGTPANFVACNFAKRVKTFKGLTPYQLICKSSTNEPNDINQTRTIKFRDQTPRCLSCCHSDRVEVKTYRSEIPASLVQDGAESAVESAYVERFSQHDSTDDAVQSDSIRVATYEHDRKTRPPSLSKSRHLGAVHSGH